jgi:hypothetical protein
LLSFPACQRECISHAIVLLKYGTRLAQISFTHDPSLDYALVYVLLN